MPVKVLTDHKDLEYFMTTKKLTLRQARWAEFLSKFNFIVSYQTGKKNNKTDVFTRKPNKRPINNKNKRQKHRMQTLLPPECVKMHSIEVTDQFKEGHKTNQQESHKSKKSEGHKPERQEGIEAEPQQQAEEEEKKEELATLPERVKESNRKNAWFTEIREYLANPVG